MSETRSILEKYTGYCIYRSDGNTAKQRCGAEFKKLNTAQVCCPDHSAAYNYLPRQRRKDLRAAAGLPPR